MLWQHANNKNTHLHTQPPLGESHVPCSALALVRGSHTLAMFTTNVRHEKVPIPCSV